MTLNTWIYRFNASFGQWNVCFRYVRLESNWVCGKETVQSEAATLLIFLHGLGERRPVRADSVNFLHVFLHVMLCFLLAFSSNDPSTHSKHEWCCCDVILTLGLKQLQKETCPGWVTMMRHLLRWTCKRRLARKIPLLVVPVIVHFLCLFVPGDSPKQQEWWVVPNLFNTYKQATVWIKLNRPCLCNPFTSYLPCRVHRIAKDSHKINIETYWNRNDEFVESSRCAEVLGEASLPPAKTPSIVLFDGRGHGNSSGWTGGGPEQFHWKSLGLDMLQVAGAHRTCLSQPWAPSYIFGGCSMGAAAAVSLMQSVNS